jgi:type II secretory pathway component PulM
MARKTFSKACFALRPLAATHTAHLYRIAISHAEPAEDGSLHVSLENMPFDRLVVWLDTMHRERGAAVTQISVQKTGQTTGEVNAQIVLHARGD